MEKKITIAEQFDNVIAFAKANGATEDMLAFLEDRKVKSIKKKSDKPSKVQIENIELGKQVLEFLATVDKASATEILKGTGLDVSLPKVTSILGGLIKSGDVVRTEEKGKARFSLATEVDEDEAE